MTGRIPDAAQNDAGAGATFQDVPKTHWAYYEISEATTVHGFDRANYQETWDKGQDQQRSPSSGKKPRGTLPSCACPTTAPPIWRPAPCAPRRPMLMPRKSLPWRI